MTIEPHALRYLGVYEEPAGSTTYAVDHSSTPGDFLAVPYKEGTLEFDEGRTDLDPMAGKVRLDGHSEKVVGPVKPTGKFNVTLHSHGLDLDGDVAAPTTSTWALLRILKAICGGSTATTNPGTQTLVVSSTTTTVTVTATHGARFSGGGVIACQTTSGSSLLELREILSVSGDIVTVKEAFSAAPVASTPVRGGVTVYMTEDPDTSLQFLIEGRELSDRFVFGGMQGGFGIAINQNGLSELSFNLAGALFSHLSDGSGVTVPTYSVFSPVPCVASILTVPTVGTTTRTVVHQTDVKLEIGIQYEAVASGSGVNGIRRMRRLPSRPLVKGSFTTPFEDSTWRTAHTSREDRALFLQLGNLAGSACLISLPTIQIGQPKRAAAGAVAGETVPFEARHDTSALATTTALSYSAMRLHFV